MDGTTGQAERYLSVAAVRDRYGLGERTIRRLIAKDQLTVVRPAGLRRVLILESAVIAFIARKGGE
jgi:excisionase family DNA binding protein